MIYKLRWTIAFERNEINIPGNHHVTRQLQKKSIEKGKGWKPKVGKELSPGKKNVDIDR